MLISKFEKSIEFKDIQGKVILVRKTINDNGEVADTYYVYNEYNPAGFCNSASSYL